MKQGNGSDLLGANDPRASTIGIIYVAPNDDRDSVLTAILTQEKLGRKQIALVLPNQNKAFQRPVDFDGLKNMRRKLQAQLIIVAPQGSSPAEFARQRRFPFYTSIVNYKESLQEENDATRASRRGWFGGGNKKQPGTDGANSNFEEPPSQEHVPSSADDLSQRELDDPHAAPNINAAAMGIGMGAAGLAAGNVMNMFDDEHDEVPLHPPAPYVNEEDDDIQLSPGGPPPRSSGYSNLDEHDLEHIDTNPLPPQAGRAPDEPSVPMMPLPIPIADDDFDEEPGAYSPTPMRQANTGPRPAVVPGVPVVVPRQGPTAGNYAAPPPPPAVFPGGGGNAGRPPRRRRSGWQLFVIGLVALLLLSLLLCGGIALAAPGVLGSFGNAVSHVIPASSPTATVTITPKSQDLSNSYAIAGVTNGTPDPTKRQVEARVLTFTSQPASKTVSTTGIVNTPSIRAIGALTFFNGTLSPYGVAAGTLFTDSQGVVVTNDVLAYIPAGNPNTGFGRVSVSAHAVNGGTRGNIRALDFNTMQCCGSSSVSVSNNAAFSGGQDPQHYTAVQQSDITNAANPLIAQLKPTTSSALMTQKNANEQFVNASQCTPKVTSNHNVGDKATTVTVTVTVTCSGEVYDLSGPTGAQSLASNLLKNEAPADITRNDPNANAADYALQGNTVATTVTQITPGKNGALSLQVSAEGIWVYQFDAAKLAHLKTLIAGKAKSMASTILLGQAGVSQVNGIVLSDSSSTLPTDVTLITIVVKAVPGVPGTPTVTPGTPGAGSPTPVGTRTSPIPAPTGSPGK